MIRPFERQDFSEVLRLTENAAFSSSWTPEVLKSEFEVAESLSLWGGPRLLAFVLYRLVPPTVEISWLASDSQKLRQGHMRTLLQSLIQHLEDAPRQYEEIWLEVEASNSGALGFYGQMGFHEQGVRKNYYRGQIDAIILCKSISKGLPTSEG